MPDKYYALRSVLIAALLPAISVGFTSSAKPPVVEQTLQAIEDCMVRSPAPWPVAWQQEYVDTIRHAISLHQDTPRYAERLGILRRGFELYWQDLNKSRERSLFEVHRAQIRWYTEHLMGKKLLSEDERQKLRNQYKDLWNYAACSLLTQFPFLDANTVHLAKADHLGECYRKIEAPLLPIYLCPLSEAQMGKIKQRWDNLNLRYARVDLWRQLGGEAIMSVNKQQVSPHTHPHYLLTQRSLTRLLPHIWAIVAAAPDYYRSAIGNWINAEKRRYQSRRKAKSDERRLEKQLSRKLLQTEHISFLLTALLETPRCFEESVSISAQEEITLEQQDRTAKGGGAYEVENVLPEK